MNIVKHLSAEESYFLQELVETETDTKGPGLLEQAEKTLNFSQITQWGQLHNNNFH